jgi:ABC-2 type transport system permease protein
MRKYLHVAKMSFHVGFIYRAHFFFSALGNMLYMVFIYFLWKAVYGNSASTLHGMTFEQVFLYLAFAASVLVLFKSYMEYEISDQVLTGKLVMQLLKPLDYQVLMIFRQAGFMLFNALVVTVPTFFVLCIIFGRNMHLGVNVLFFLVALGMAFITSVIIDFIVGCISFYTESIWGISLAKEAFVMFLSGAMVPIPFFPEVMQHVIAWLPFKGIYNVPLSILTDNSMTVASYCSGIGVQCVWVVVLYLLSRAFFSRASRQVTVNGG